MNKEYLSWEQLSYYCNKFVNKELSKNNNHNFKPIVIGIGVGGLIPAAIIGKGLDCRVYNLGISSRSTDMSIKKDVEIYQIPETHILRESPYILLVDDLVDTGTTFERAKEILREKAGKELYFKSFAVFAGAKMDCTTASTERPDFIYGRLYDNKTTWIDFPWEIG